MKKTLLLMLLFNININLNSLEEFEDGDFSTPAPTPRAFEAAGVLFAIGRQAKKTTPQHHCGYEGCKSIFPAKESLKRHKKTQHSATLTSTSATAADDDDSSSTQSELSDDDTL